MNLTHSNLEFQRFSGLDSSTQFGGGGKAGGDAPAPTAPVVPDAGPSAEELAEQERARQEENARQLEVRRTQSGTMGEQSALGGEDETKKKRPTLLGGTTSGAINTSNVPLQ